MQRRFLRKRSAVGSVLALSGAYAPALPKGEPLAKLHTLQLSRKLFRTAKASLHEGGGIVAGNDEAFKPYCTEIVEVTTAESFS